jgi:hypothetical protein
MRQAQMFEAGDEVAGLLKWADAQNKRRRQSPVPSRLQLFCGFAVKNTHSAPHQPLALKVFAKNVNLLYDLICVFVKLILEG